MAPMAVVRGLAKLRGLRGAEVEHLPQSLRLQVRLISQHNCPVRESRLPSRPLRGALDRTEHAALRGRIANAVLFWEAEAVQFSSDGQVAGSADHGDLVRPERLPLLDQMAEHCSAAPGKQQRGLAHAR